MPSSFARVLPCFRTFTLGIYQHGWESTVDYCLFHNGYLSACKTGKYLPAALCRTDGSDAEEDLTKARPLSLYCAAGTTFRKRTVHQDPFLA